MNTVSLFDTMNQIGKIGETAVYNYYNSRGIDIIDVSHNPFYQAKDIDFIINGQSVEVKTGTKIKDYQQICLELVSNSDKDFFRKGFLFTTEAEVIIFYSPQEQKMYQIIVSELRKYYNDNKDNIETRVVYNNEFGSVIKESVLAFIPLKDLQKLKGYRVISLYP